MPGVTKHSITKEPSSEGFVVPGEEGYTIKVRYERGATALTLIQCFGASHPLPARSTMDIKENVPLAPFTTLHIGGPAKYMLSAQSIEDIQAGLKFATEKDLKVFILGGGSNLLVDDKGFYGLVIKIELQGVHIEEAKTSFEGSSPDPSEGFRGNSKIVIVAAAGEVWDALVECCVSEQLWGIENLSGIPGTVGGAVVQNIGAYGAALSETLLWVEALDTAGQVKRFTIKECTFEYRESIFKHHPEYIVLRAAFALSTVPKPNTTYKDLSKLFTDTSADIQAVRRAVLAIRKGKFPDLTVEGTAGSFFKNPILPLAEAEALTEKYPDMPIFEMPETTGVKVPLAWLLDNVLQLKGTSVGGARLYEKQPLVIAAKRNTSSADVKTLAEKVIHEVKEKCNLQIEAEVKII
jgi:UDP-N-acetylmuramate dehydrogenase